jgi:RNA polymerase sigma-70 factor (ECF subfamily)
MGVLRGEGEGAVRAARSEPCTPAAPTDERLVEYALEGDRSAFEMLVKRHQRGIVHYLYRLTGSRDTALDLAQDAFLKVYQALPTFDSRYRFTTWLYRIASNCARDAFRKRRLCSSPLDSGAAEPASNGSPERSLASGGPSPLEALRFRELEARLERAIGRLPLRYRQALLLRHRHHCRYDEIARILHLPIGTVKNRIFRAREMLRAELEDILGEEALS